MSESQRTMLEFLFWLLAVLLLLGGMVWYLTKRDAPEVEDIEPDEDAW